MAKTSEQMCAFCGKKAGGDVGGLHNTTDNSILAHYDCLIFSPQVITTESDDEPEFDISSVLAEIKRGKKMKCSYCKQPGATIGCDIKRCHKTYHYVCVEKDKGTRDSERYVVYCSKHKDIKKDSDTAQETERSRTSDGPSTSYDNEMLKCSYCKKRGATIDCNIETCNKTYHYLCVEEDEGVIDVSRDEQHVVYCFKHAKHAKKDSDALQETERSRTSDGSSTSDEDEIPEKRKHKSAPGNYSSQRTKTKNIEQDMQRSVSSERPSTSYENTARRTRNRNSDTGVYSFQLENKKSSPAQESGWYGLSSSSSTSQETPVRKMKRKSGPRQIFRENMKRTRSTGDNVEDQQAGRDEASNGANLKTTMSALSVMPKARRGRPPSKRKRLEAASTQKRPKNSVDSEDIQQSDGGVEREETNAQARDAESQELDAPTRGEEREETDARASGKEREETDAQASGEEREETDAQARGEEREETDAQARGEEREETDAQASGEEREETDAQASGEEREETDAQASGEEREETDAQARNADREEINVEVESNEDRNVPLSQHMSNDLSFPSTSQAHFNINESYFSKLYESQCKIASSIESGVSEFRNFVEQFQTLFKQFLEICQSLNHGICNNLTNGHGQNTSPEVHQRQDATPDPLPLSQLNSHFPALTHDSANNEQGADTNIETPSPENTLPSVAKVPGSKRRSSMRVKKKYR